MNKALNITAVAASFICFAYFTFTSNYFDWDQFYSFIEADRRAWLHGEWPPTWSYLLCAGNNRLADPQSFALSPLFIFPLFFGTVLGTKLMLLFTYLIGYIFVRKIFKILLGESSSSHKDTLINLLPLFYIFSGYFIAHTNVGHISFINFHLFSVVSYFVFKAIEEKPNRSDKIYCFLAIFTIMMGGFYHSFVFWALPFGLALLLFLLFRFQKETFKNTIPFLLIAFLLSSFKLLQTFLYQLNAPRNISHASTQETSDLIQILINLFVPVKDFKDYFFSVPHFQLWGIFEYTAFSLLPLLAMVFWQCFSLSNVKKLVRTEHFFLCVSILLVFFLFSLGNFHSLSPLSLFNQYIFSDSIRVIGRFNLGLVFALFCLFALLIRNFEISKDHFYSLIILLAILNIYIFIPHFTFDHKSFLKVYQLESKNTDQMTQVMLAPKGNLLTHHNFSATMQGYPLLNCYSPAMQEFAAIPEISKKPFKTYYPILANQEEHNLACIQGTYLRQDKIIISDYCDREVCFLVNAVSQADWASGIQLSKEKNLYCRN